jgi:hypothetical protein
LSRRTKGPLYIIWAHLAAENTFGVPRPDRAIRSNKKPFFLKGWGLRCAQTPKNKKLQGFLFRFYPLRVAGVKNHAGKTQSSAYKDLMLCFIVPAARRGA